jgi:hypothetical protein
VEAAVSRLSPAVCMASILMAPVSSLAHHSAAMYETEKTVTVSGTVKDFEYVNPHAWLNVVVTDDSGEHTLWGFEAEGPSVLIRSGIKKDALQPGDLVTVKARPLRDGRPAGDWVSVTKADGTVLAAGGAAADRGDVADAPLSPARPVPRRRASRP